MPITPVELRGERVRLLPMQAEHTPDLVVAGRSRDIWPYMPLRGDSAADMERLVQEALAAKATGQELPFVIVDQTTDRIVGSTRLYYISEPDRYLEIGWTWHTPEVWRTRINTESKYLLLTHAFEALSAIRVQLKTDARNLRSQRAIERLGATREGCCAGTGSRTMATGATRSTTVSSTKSGRR